MDIVEIHRKMYSDREGQMLCTLTRALSSRRPALYVRAVHAVHAVHAVNCTKCVSTHAQYDRFHTSVKKQQSFHTRECTTARLHAKNYASIRFCRRSGPTTKFLNVCENFARNVGHYCPFTRSSFCNISQTLRRNVGCFRRVKMALHSYGAPFVK